MTGCWCFLHGVASITGKVPTFTKLAFPGLSSSALPVWRPTCLLLSTRNLLLVRKSTKSYWIKRSVMLKPLLMPCFTFDLENGGPFLDHVLVLQNYAEGWTDGKWEEKVDIRPCIDKLMYTKDKQGYYR